MKSLISRCAQVLLHFERNFYIKKKNIHINSYVPTVSTEKAKKKLFRSDRNRFDFI